MAAPSPPTREELIARLFGSPEGESLLQILETDWTMPILSSPVIRRIIAQQRERWSTGGAVRTISTLVEENADEPHREGAPGLRRLGGRYGEGPR